jgi:hypothetical protein
MSTSMSWMKFILVTLIILISCTGFNNGQEIEDLDTVYQPAYFRDTIQPRKMVSQCKQNGTQNCYLLEAVQLILTYGRDESDLEALLDSIPDNVDLNFILILALQRWAQFIEANPQLEPSKIEKN